MIKRNLDGCYFRVKRDSKFENICFTDLTVEEQEKVIDGKTDEWLKSLLLHIADRLRRIGDDFDLEIVE